MPWRLAEFTEPDEMLAAVRALRSEGYERLEAFTPAFVPELAEALEVPRSRTPQLMFGAGALGACAGALVQWWCNAHDYPLNVGGRPLASVPAWIPIMFEMTVLGAAVTGFFALMVSSRLPRLVDPIERLPGSERGTLDRYLLVIDGGDPKFVADKCLRVLKQHRAAQVVDGEVER